MTVEGVVIGPGAESGYWSVMPSLGTGPVEAIDVLRLSEHWSETYSAGQAVAIFQVGDQYGIAPKGNNTQSVLSVPTVAVPGIMEAYPAQAGCSYLAQQIGRFKKFYEVAIVTAVGGSVLGIRLLTGNRAGSTYNNVWIGSFRALSASWFSTGEYVLVDMRRGDPMIAGWWSTVLPSGTVYGWGRNFYGTLGLGDHVDRLTPTSTGLSKMVGVAVGENHSLALSLSNELYGAGEGINPLFGLAATSVFVGIGGLPSLAGASLTCGRYDSFLLLADGRVYGAGNNDWGALGIGEARPSTGELLPLPFSCIAISSRVSHTMCVTSAGEIYGTGYGVDGQLAFDAGHTYTFAKSRTPTDPGGLPITMQNVTADFGSCTVVDGVVYATNRFLSPPAQFFKNTSHIIMESERWRSPFLVVGHSYDIWAGITTGGDVYAYNAFGKFGDAELVTALGNYEKAICVAGENLLVIKDDGSLWGLGSNSNGELGLGHTARVDSLEMVDGGVWLDIAGSGPTGSSVLGIKQP